MPHSTQVYKWVPANLIELINKVESLMELPCHGLASHPGGVEIHLAPVVERVDNAIHRINHYPVDSVVCFANTYPLDSDLSVG